MTRPTRRRKSANGDPQPRKITRQLADGSTVTRYRITVTVGRTPAGKLDRRTREFAKQADALAWKRDQLASKASGPVSLSARRATVAEMLDRWLATIEANRAEATHENYGYAVRLHISPGIGSIRLDRLEAADVERWLADMLARSVGARTRQNAFRVLRTALAAAVRRGDLARNVCDVIDPPSAPREPIDPFTRDEVRQILEDTADRRLGPLYRVLFSTGIRQGEAFGLRWQDVDLEAGTLRIVRQAVETKGRIVFSQPKTSNSIRTIPLTPSTVNALRAHRDRLCNEGNADVELVFCGRKGKPIRRSAFGAREWKKTLQRLAIRHRGAHHTRHTYATLMLGEGVPLPVVAKRLGHARPSITADIYSHAVADQIDAARVSESRLFG